MVLYKAKKSSPIIKFILVVIVFVTVLCLTYSDVSGAINPF